MISPDTEKGHSPFVTPGRRKGDRLILKKEVLARVGLSYVTIWERMRRGEFPRSVVLGNKVAWYESEVDAWLESLKRTRLKGD